MDGDQTSGVRMTCPAILCSAARISAKETMKEEPLSGHMRIAAGSEWFIRTTRRRRFQQKSSIAEWFIRTAKIGLCLPSCCRGFANLSNHEDEKNSSEFFEADMREKRSGFRSKNFVLLLSQV
jgi:hypothetical protein